MTKFERAKRQTLKKWNLLIDEVLQDVCWSYEDCGFCEAYLDWTNWKTDENKICSKCPIKKWNKDSCMKDGSWYDQLNENEIPDILAVLIYVHQLQDPAR